MSESFTHALEIVGVGVGGVFVNLLILMLVMKAIGMIFGPAKKQKKTKKAETAA